MNPDATPGWNLDFCVNRARQETSSQMLSEFHRRHRNRLSFEFILVCNHNNGSTSSTRATQRPRKAFAGGVFRAVLQEKNGIETSTIGQVES